MHLINKYAEIKCIFDNVKEVEVEIRKKYVFDCVWKPNLYLIHAENEMVVF